MGPFSSVSGEAPKSRAALAKSLEKAIGFSEAALESNRKGVLAKEQRVILTRKIKQSIFPGAVAVTIWLILWTMYGTMVRKLSLFDAVWGVLVRVVNPALIYRPDIFTMPDKTPLILAGAALSLMMLLIFVLLQIHPGLFIDLWSNAVNSVQGKVLLQEESVAADGTPVAPKFYYVVKDDRFRVTEEAYRAIDEGGIYTLYFGARSREIVAVHLEREAEPEPASAVGRPLPELIPFHRPLQ